MSYANALSVRRVNEADLDELVLLIKSHAEYERASIDITGLRSRLAQGLNKSAPHLHIFVAEYGSQLSGYCSLSVDYSTWRGREFLHMDCLYVSPHVRGIRLGTKLFQTAEEFAKRMGLDEMQWQSPQWNRKAQGFYEFLGATSNLKRRYVYRV